MKKNQLCERNHVLTTTPYMYGTLPRKSINIKTRSRAPPRKKKKKRHLVPLFMGRNGAKTFGALLITPATRGWFF